MKSFERLKNLECSGQECQGFRIATAALQGVSSWASGVSAGVSIGKLRVKSFASEQRQQSFIANAVGNFSGVHSLVPMLFFGLLETNVCNV